MERGEHAFAQLDLRDLERDYGPAFARYDGFGTLLAPTGTPCPCHFTLLPLRRGVPVVLTSATNGARFFELYALGPDQKLKLLGASLDGLTVEVEGIEEAFTPPKREEHHVGSPYSWRAERIRVCEHTDVPGSWSCFGLSNLRLPPHDIDFEAGGHQLRLRRVPEYDRRVARLAALRDVDVTAELTVPTFDDETELLDLVDSICGLLSVAAGCRVVHAYRYNYNHRDEVVSRSYHRWRTTHFTYLSTLHLESANLAEFLGTCLPVYRVRKKTWPLFELTSAFLDTKNERDAIQSRAVKLSVTAEMLKAEFVRTEGVPERLLDDSSFKKLQKTLKSAVTADLPGPEKKALRAKLYERLGDLQRRPYRDLLGELLALICWEPPKEELDHFIECRNALVHTGRFLCERQGGRPADSSSLGKAVTDEYFFLVSFLDRLFLKLVGYDGPYVPQGDR